VRGASVTPAPCSAIQTPIGRSPGRWIKQTEALVAREAQAADQPLPEDPGTRALERRAEDATGYRTRIDVSRHGAGRVVIRVSGSRQLETLIAKLLG
jgi:hypothetical protein